LYVACFGEMRNAYKILVRRPRHRWGDNIRVDLMEIGCCGLIHLAQNRSQRLDLKKTVINLLVP